MAEMIKITETARRGLEPVNPKLFGQYDQLASLLARQLGPEHAFLFAEPVALGGSATEDADTAWYVKGRGHPIRLSDLPEEESTAVDARLRSLHSDIINLAEQMEKEGLASQELARFLRDALTVPDVSRIWSLEGKPVLVDWGYRIPSGITVSAANAAGWLTARKAVPLAVSPAVPPAASADAPAPADKPEAADDGASTPPPPPPAASAPSSGWRRHLPAVLSALALAFIGLALAARLLLACDLGPLWPETFRTLFPDTCPGAAASPEIQTLGDAQRLVEATIRERERSLAEKIGSCAAACAPQPPASDIERRVEHMERGVLEVTLSWDGPADLDLSIFCPDGTRLDYNSPKGSDGIPTACGGRLVSRDLNDGNIETMSPVEHIIFRSLPVNGVYIIYTTMFHSRREENKTIPFIIIIRYDGKVYKKISNNITNIDGIIYSFALDVPLDGRQ